MSSTLRVLALTFALATTGVTLAGCSSGDGVAQQHVRNYLDALAAGDATAAHIANPYSPTLTAEGTAVSAAGRHVQIVNVGGFEEATDPLAAAETPEPSSSTTAEGSNDTSDWWGIDWSSKDWAGIDKPDDPLTDSPSAVTQGVVPVTLGVAGSTVTVPVGVAVGKDKDGRELAVFRAVPLSAEQQARWGVTEAAPAIAPAIISVGTDTEPEATPGATPTTAADQPSWWEKVKDKVGEATGVVSATPVTVAGITVELVPSAPLAVLPGEYDIAVPEPAAGALFAAPASPQPVAAPLLPGQEHTIAVGDPQVTDTGRRKVHDELDKLAETQHQAMVSFEVSDREQACGTLAPPLFGASRFETGGTFTTANTNIASGGITITARSSDGTKGNRSGNGNVGGFADEAFCAGKKSATATTWDQPVTVETSNLTGGQVTVNPDGTFTTSSPWRLTMTTKQVTVTTQNATGAPVYPAVKTTYKARVDIEWRPAGQLDADGTVKITTAAP